jgi:predicted MFS family arabinose efflux permease
MILIICCSYSFLGNAFLLGPSPYITLYANLFDVSQTRASGLISYPNLAYGFGSLLLVPMYLKFGRRPVMLGSMICVSRISTLPWLLLYTRGCELTGPSFLLELLGPHKRIPTAVS